MFSRVSAGIRATCRVFNHRRYSTRGSVYPVVALQGREVNAAQVTHAPAWRGIHTCSANASPLVAFNLPDVGERIATVIVKEWLVKEGDTVSMGDAICEVQSDKSAATVYSPYDGVVKEVMVEEEETAYLEKPLVIFEVEEGVAGVDAASTPPAAASGQSTEDSPDATASTRPASGKVQATPAVRRLAVEKGVDLAEVTPTGKGGRVVKEDIFSYLEQKTVPVVGGPIKPTPSSPFPPSPSPPPSAEDRVEPITGFKSVMVQTMTESGRIPQFGYKDEVNMDQLVQLRSLLKASLAERNAAFSYMPVLIKALSLALHHHPVLNSTVDSECTTITYRANHNVGVAMDTPQGLIVPNVKKVQEKSVFEIAVELNRLQQLGSRGELPPADTADGTISLSNIGAIGGTYANPMLLPPSVAICAFGRVQVVPRFDSEGDLERGHVMHVSWAADHRVIDGAEVARFSNRWKSYVENPATMIVDMK